MEKKQLLFPALIIMLAAQLGCVSVSNLATQSPPEGPCPAETADLKLLTRADEGYCLLYPADDSLLPPQTIVINPASATADTPGDAWVDISVEAASGRSAAQAADGQITAAGEGFNITRNEIRVDGNQAIVVDGLPGPDPWRKVFIVSNDRLYTLSFLPWTPNVNAFPSLEKLYATVIDSLHFLPPVNTIPTAPSP